MQIERIFYPIESLGYGKRIGIWTVGCPHACFNCSNPELWEANPQKDLSLEKVFQMLRSIKEPIDGITISGGEPFQQVEDLAKLVSFIRAYITEDILIYSGYTREQLESWNSEHVSTILNTIAVLIDGIYIEAKNDNLPLRGSSNQKVHILNETYRERYEQLLHGKRKVQLVSVQEDILAFGIPVKQTKAMFEQALPDYGITMDQSKG